MLIVQVPVPVPVPAQKEWYVFFKGKPVWLVRGPLLKCYDLLDFALSIYPDRAESDYVVTQNAFYPHPHACN